jgi:hypothetical protein
MQITLRHLRETVAAALAVEFGVAELLNLRRQAKRALARRQQRRKAQRLQSYRWPREAQGPCAAPAQTMLKAERVSRLAVSPYVGVFVSARKVPKRRSQTMKRAP